MMKIKAICALITVSCAVMIGCSQYEEEGEEVTNMVIGHIDAEEVLTLNPDADIFQFGDLIYETNIDWVDELTLTPDEAVGEIKILNDSTTDFENETANKLPVGTVIYSTKEHSDMLVVDIDGQFKNYYALVEG